MKEYHKIQTVFFKNPESGFKTIMEGHWALPEFEFLKNLEWMWTEKINGMNTRVIWDEKEIKIVGKTDDAEMPRHLLQVLEETFTMEKMSTVFNNPCCLYGEGFGDNIQSVGRRYLAGYASFVLFDCRIGNFWLERHNLEIIAGKLKIPIAPLIGRGSLLEAVDFAHRGFKSLVAEDKHLPAEGLIMKPKVELFNRKGERIVSKIKFKDFRS